MIVLAAGVALRVLLVWVYRPAHLTYIDSSGYAREALGPLFVPHFYRPAGYSAFLAVAHAIWGNLQATIILQHAAGLVTAAVFYFAVLRLGQPRWVALVPAAVTALTYDVMYFEHTLLSEWLFMLLLAGALYAAARLCERATAPRAAVAWAAGAGVLIGLATPVRAAGLFLIPVFVVAVLLRPTVGVRARVLPAAVLVLAAGAILLAYADAQYQQTDSFGFVGGRGWSLYGRTAPFADCGAFTPPKGTEALCESSDAGKRLGPEHYMWEVDSPALRLFPGGPPTNDKEVGSFGRAALVAQPKAFISAVATDLWRYVDSKEPGQGRRGFGLPPSSLDLRVRNPVWETLNHQVVDQLYGTVDVRVHRRVYWVGRIQEIVRVHGVIVLLAVILAFAAFPFAGRDRLAVLLLSGTAITSMVLAVVAQQYNWRYAVPTTPLLLAGGAVGLRVLVTRLAPMLRPAAATTGSGASTPPRPSASPARPPAA